VSCRSTIVERRRRRWRGSGADSDDGRKGRKEATGRRASSTGQGEWLGRAASLVEQKWQQKSSGGVHKYFFYISFFDISGGKQGGGRAGLPRQFPFSNTKGAPHSWEFVLIELE
jgi:hypothetical protein